MSRAGPPPSGASFSERHDKQGKGTNGLNSDCDTETSRTSRCSGLIVLYGNIMIFHPGATGLSSKPWGCETGPRVELSCEMGTTVIQNFGVDLWSHFLPSFSVPIALGR